MTSLLAGYCVRKGSVDMSYAKWTYHNKGGKEKQRAYRLRRRIALGLPPPIQQVHHACPADREAYKIQRQRDRRHQAALDAGRVPGKPGRPRKTSNG